MPASGAIAEPAMPITCTCLSLPIGSRSRASGILRGRKLFTPGGSEDLPLFTAPQRAPESRFSPALLPRASRARPAARSASGALCARAERHTPQERQAGLECELQPAAPLGCPRLAGRTRENLQARFRGRVLVSQPARGASRRDPLATASSLGLPAAKSLPAHRAPTACLSPFAAASGSRQAKLLQRHPQPAARLASSCSTRPHRPEALKGAKPHHSRAGVPHRDPSRPPASARRTSPICASARGIVGAR